MKTQRAQALRAFYDWRNKQPRVPNNSTFYCIEKEDVFYFVIEQNRKMKEHWVLTKGTDEYKRLI